MRVAGLVAGEPQATDEGPGHPRQGRFSHDATGGVQHRVGNAIGVEDAGVVPDMIELLGGPEQLERALLAVIVGNAGLGAQVAQHVAAVLGQAHHPALCCAGRLPPCNSPACGRASRRKRGSKLGHTTRGRWRIISHFIALRGMPGAAQGAEYPGETWPALAKLVSSPAAG